MKSKKSYLIKKPSAMIQTNVKNLTLIQRKLINNFIHIVQKEDIKEIYTASLKSLKKMCGIGSMKGNDVLKTQIRDLTKINIEYNYLNKDNEVWGVSVLLAGAEILPNTGIVKFALSPFIRNKVLNPSMYAPLNIKLIVSFKCSYSVVLYEFLRDYLTAKKIPRLEIEQLRDLLGVKKGTHKEFRYFRRDVLNIAVKEINDKTDIKCSYELISTVGRKYSHIQFLVERKPLPITKLIEGKLETKKEKADKKNMDDSILNVLLKEHKTVNVANLVSEYMGKGTDYIISNIKYVYSRKDVENFSAYLKTALKHDYGEEIRRKEQTEIEVQTQLAEKNINLMKKILNDLNKPKTRPELFTPGKTLSIEDIAKENLIGKLKKEAKLKDMDLKKYIEDILNI